MQSLNPNMLKRIVEMNIQLATVHIATADSAIDHMPGLIAASAAASLAQEIAVLDETDTTWKMLTQQATELLEQYTAIYELTSHNSHQAAEAIDQPPPPPRTELSAEPNRRTKRAQFTGFQIGAIKQAFQEGRSLASIAKEYNTPRNTIEGLYNKYQKQLNLPPLKEKKRGTPISDEMTQAIRAALQNGDSINAVAKQHGLTWPVVSRIADELKQVAEEGTDTQTNSDEDTPQAL